MEKTRGRKQGATNHGKEWYVTEMDFYGNPLSKARVFVAAKWSDLKEQILTYYKVEQGMVQYGLNLDYIRKDYRNKEKSDKELIISRMMYENDEFSAYFVKGSTKPSYARYYMTLDLETEDGTASYPRMWMIEKVSALDKGEIRTISNF
jgi:hypothetical protein